MDIKDLQRDLSELQSLRQAIGSLGLRLQRTKPGTKLHRKYWASLTALENKADEHASRLRLALWELSELRGKS